MRKKTIPVWALSFAFFAVLYFGFGVGLYPDSDSYIHMTAEREPLYPLFLHLCRRVLGEGYLMGAAAVQNLLGACSVAYFTCTLGKLFAERRRPLCQWLCTFLLWCCALMPHLMTPLGSASHMVPTNSILTEGLTYSIYLFFSAELIRGLLERESRMRNAGFGRAFFAAFLMTLLRSHLMTTFAIWLIAAGVAVLEQKAVWKRKVLRCGGLALALLSAFLLRSVCFQHYYDHYCNGYSGAELGNVGFLANVIYLADGTEDVIIEDKELQSLYEEMLVRRQARGWQLTRVGGPLEQALHYEDCYDHLKFEVIQPVLERHLQDNGVTGQDVNAEMYRLCGVLFRAVLPEVIGRYIRLFGCNVCLGLLRTVSLPRGIFAVLGVLVYVVALGLLVWSILTHRSRNVCLALCLAFGMTVLHVAATSAVIMCLSRYVIYNTTLFYSAGFLALCEWMKWRSARGAMGEGNGLSGFEVCG